jgi:hypothetical protein
MLRWFLAVAAAIALQQGDVRAQGACLTTIPPSPSFVPPTSYWKYAGAGTFWYGTEALFTRLPITGKWDGLHNERGFRQKLFFWAKGYDWRKEHQPELVITGRRLDGDTQDVAVTHASVAFIPSRDEAAIVTAFELPTTGCWELTAHYHGHNLVFVTLVENQ